MSAKHEVIIIGAGISGLLAARCLSALDGSVMVLDKGRGVGGRVSRRRAMESVFDHGAQYFTARDSGFRELVHELVAADVVQEWATGFEDSEGVLRDNGLPRFIGSDGMNAVAKYFARGLDVRTANKVVRVAQSGDGWVVENSDREVFYSRSLMLTAPVPQSLELLAAGEVELPVDVSDALLRVEYAPCLALLVQVAGKSRIPPPGGKWLSGDPISWIADNNQKGISKGVTSAVTIHAGSEFSKANWDMATPEVTKRLLDEAATYLEGDVVSTQLHRWKYSLPTTLHPERFVKVAAPAPLVFAGDAFGGPRVEGAALSGIAAGEALAKELSG